MQLWYDSEVRKQQNSVSGKETRLEGVRRVCQKLAGKFTKKSNRSQGIALPAVEKSGKLPWPKKDKKQPRQKAAKTAFVTVNM
jgi:hypothetical protein